MIHDPVSSTVKFNPKQGQIILDIESGFASVGNFNVFFVRSNEDQAHELFSDKPKKIQDGVPDTFVLPFTLDELTNVTLIITGKYGPAPLHNQIKVSYIFNQLDIQNLNVTELKGSSEIKTNTTDPFDRFTNIFDFSV